MVRNKENGKEPVHITENGSKDSVLLLNVCVETVHGLRKSNK